ncbi:MAG: cytochrome c maturation protein CcmE domain-containing protein [Nitrospiria bacterium]
MKTFYLRWGGILSVALILGLLGGQRYYREVSAISPDQVLSRPGQVVRVQGRIEAGSLVIEPSLHKADFQIAGEKEKISVQFTGDELDNLRELKVIVLLGKWDPAARRFESQKTALTPNYGFITAAYLVGLLPLGFFLFKMERKVSLLYALIKQEKIYQPEESL